MPDQAINKSQLFRLILDRSAATRSQRCVVKTAAILLFCAVTAAASFAQTFTSLLSFDNANGGTPYASLVQGIDGNLYSTTSGGGTNNLGTVFKMTLTGAVTTLHLFTGSDGYQPTGGLVLGMDGDFYGTTSQGGAHIGGTIFKITSAGNFTTLYNFCSQPACADGTSPDYAALILGVDGNFYGTTAGGGTSGKGTVFKISPNGTLTTLYSFSGSPDGELPIAALIQGTNGKLYGTTYQGGAFENGIVFEVTPSGNESVLYNFCSQPNCVDGAWPEAALIQASNGNFYGTTLQGGNIGVGTIYQLTPAGMLTTLYSFGAVGGNPTSALVQARNGDFYGTVLNGEEGVIEITPSGELTILHNFDITDGDNPYPGLVQDTNGTFYGTTLDGGTSNACSYGCGTVFSISVGLRPFVKTQPTSGAAGARVIILGSHLSGTTAVSFNGIAATFTASNSAIETTVPAGATTGTVTVTTPSGVLSSNVVFRVRP